MMLACAIATVAWARAQHPGVQLQANQEHVQDHAQLRKHPERRRDRRRQDNRRGFRPNPAQQGGPQDDPAHNLADHRRLAHVAEQSAQQPAGDQDRCQGHEDVDQRVRLARCRCCAAGRRCHRLRRLDPSSAGVDDQKQDDGHGNHHAIAK
jgi:hypothetical protein